MKRLYVIDREQFFPASVAIRDAELGALQVLQAGSLWCWVWLSDEQFACLTRAGIATQAAVEVAA
jgi:hypothetical protein